MENASNTVETARRHRYSLLTLDPMRGILAYAHKCGRPTIEIDRITMHHGQDEIYWPGKQRWNTIELVFYEILKTEGDTFGADLSCDQCDINIIAKNKASNSTASKIWAWWAENVISIKGSKLLTKPKTDAVLQLEDGQGGVIWQYKLYNCWPSKIAPTDLDWSESAIAEINVTLSYDKAEELTGRD